MKIHGTAKGGALSKKDFGVAFGGAATPDPFSDDSDLKGYWKFNETSGDIENVSESDETVGASGDIQITGATYNQSSGITNIDYSMLFDGTNDFGVFGSSLTDWKFFHDSSTIHTTINFWAALPTTAADDEYFFSIIKTDAGFGFLLRYKGNQLAYEVNSGSGDNRLVDQKTNSFVGLDTNWHMYTVQFDFSLADTNYTVFRDANNEANGNKIANTAGTSNSSNALTIGADFDEEKFGNFYICELSIWDRILTDDEIEELYNSGDGLPIYQ